MGAEPEQVGLSGLVALRGGSAEQRAEALAVLLATAEVGAVVEQPDAVEIRLEADWLGVLPHAADVRAEPLPDPGPRTWTGLEDDAPIRVLDDLWVRPDWVDPNPRMPAGALELVVPRGGAFGSGEHESTQAALRLLHAHWPGPRRLCHGRRGCEVSECRSGTKCGNEAECGDSVRLPHDVPGREARTRAAEPVTQAPSLSGSGLRFADIGCGSGVLTAYAVARGAGGIVACDVDLPAARATRALAPHATVFVGGPEAVVPEPGFDVVVANIAWSELEPILDAVLGLLADDGTLVLSGQRAFEEGPRDRHVGRAPAAVDRVGATWFGAVWPTGTAAARARRRAGS